MSMIWRLQHHQWTDFTYPDGKTIKVLVVPMRDKKVLVESVAEEVEPQRTPYEIECAKARSKRDKRTALKRLTARYLSTHLWSTVPIMARDFGISTYPLYKMLHRHSSIFTRDGKYGQQMIWKLKEAA